MSPAVKSLEPTLFSVLSVSMIEPILKSVLTGQAPATLEWKNTPRTRIKKQAKTGVIHVYMYIYLSYIAEASRASPKNYKKSEIGKVRVSTVYKLCCCKSRQKSRLNFRFSAVLGWDPNTIKPGDYMAEGDYPNLTTYCDKANFTHASSKALNITHKRVEPR